MQAKGLRHDYADRADSVHSEFPAEHSPATLGMCCNRCLRGRRRLFADPVEKSPHMVTRGGSNSAGPPA